MTPVFIQEAGAQDRRHHCHPALKMRKQAQRGERTPGSPTAVKTVEGVPSTLLTRWPAFRYHKDNLAPKSQTCLLPKASTCVWVSCSSSKIWSYQTQAPVAAHPQSRRLPPYRPLISWAKLKVVSFPQLHSLASTLAPLGLLPLQAECFLPSTLCEQTWAHLPTSLLTLTYGWIVFPPS